MQYVTEPLTVTVPLITTVSDALSDRAQYVHGSGMPHGCVTLDQPVSRAGADAGSQLPTPVHRSNAPVAMVMLDAAIWTAPYTSTDPP